MVFLYTKYTINILRIDQLFQQNPPIKITEFEVLNPSSKMSKTRLNSEKIRNFEPKLAIFDILSELPDFYELTLNMIFMKNRRKRRYRMHRF